MNCSGSTPLTKLFELDFPLNFLFILAGEVITALTLLTL